uniref:Phostensin/Taperin PP1-binding domain-containing protein n=1 Tax=Otus sunia TaxID=257818 RepID=A0A8C8AE62_9STRI
MGWPLARGHLRVWGQPRAWGQLRAKGRLRWPRGRGTTKGLGTVEGQGPVEGCRTVKGHGVATTRSPGATSGPPGVTPGPPKKRYPTAEEIQVIGGYLALPRSCLAKNDPHRKKVGTALSPPVPSCPLLSP